MSWKKIVKSVAPILGTALGGGPLGGMAMKAMADALLGPDEKLEGKALEAKIEYAISNDPDALLKLKKADQDFEAKMKEYDIDIYKIDADDRNSARELAVKTSLTPQLVIASVFVLGFVIVLYAVFSGDIQMTPDQKDIAMFLLGILSAGIIQIMNFFFGSSSGSKEKTSQLSNPKP